MPSLPEQVRYRWRLFVAAEAGLLLLGLDGALSSRTWPAIPLVVVWVWLVFTLPVFVLYLIGRPPVMTLSPLIDSTESRAFRRELKGRPELSDEEFYARFYQESGISEGVVERVRGRLARELGRLVERAFPGDPLWRLVEDVDFADVLDKVGEEFRLEFTDAVYPSVDGTLDNVIRLVHARVGQAGECTDVAHPLAGRDQNKTLPP